MNPVQKGLVAGAMVAAALTGGAIGATMIGTAGADTTSTAQSTPSTTAPAQSAPTDDHDRGGHQANGKTETVLSGDDASKATAAAQAAVPGATVDRAETDAEGAAYEVHMTKSDGSRVTVKLDSNFTVTDTIDGMG